MILLQALVATLLGLLVLAGLALTLAGIKDWLPFAWPLLWIDLILLIIIWSIKEILEE